MYLHPQIQISNAFSANSLFLKISTRAKIFSQLNMYFTYSNFRYPVGMGLAMCSSRRLPLEENNFMEFSMPILFVLAEDGLLCGYYAVNQMPNAVQITKPNGAPSMDNIRNGSIIIPKSLKGITYKRDKLYFFGSR